MGTFKPELTAYAPLLLPLFLHFGLVVGLYGALTWARLTAVRRGDAATTDFAKADGDPPLSARIERNQFEAPVFVWIAALLLMFTDQATTWDIAAACVFLAGRLIHSAVQCSNDKVALRGQVFTINFLALLWLMGRAGLAAMGFA